MMYIRPFVQVYLCEGSDFFCRDQSNVLNNLKHKKMILKYKNDTKIKDR